MKPAGRFSAAAAAGRAFACSAVCLLALLLMASPAAGQVPPDARWAAFETANFRVTYMEGLEEIARRAGDRAEVVHATLASELVSPPKGKIELVIADNVDFSNGYATPFPTNRVVIFANPPVGEPSLSFYDDWLQLLITHELVHIFHLDYARGIWRPFRTIFGRNPMLFPHRFSPTWVTEGLATYFESRLTQGGRVRGTLHDMALRTAVLEDAFFTIDRTTGDPSGWPGPAGPYIYGSMFVEHLARRYGPENIPSFVEAAGGKIIPFRLDAAARRAFGTTFTREWRVWEDSLRSHYAAVEESVRASGVTEPEILAAEGRFAAHPRFSPDGTSLVFARATGREEAGLRLLRSDGSERTIAPLTTLAPPSWTSDGSSVVVSQLEHVDPYRTYSDVYRIGMDGERNRLTSGARLQEASVHPDGERVVGVENSGGTNVLVVRSLRSGEAELLTAPELDVHWAMPRWDPSGERIAASRWRAGGLHDVVILDAAGGVLRELTTDRAVDSAPAWSADGRYVLFSSDRTGIPNIFAYDLHQNRLLQVTNVLTGAFQPDASPDARWIAFSYYQADGYAIARIPYEPGTWRAAPPLRGGLEPLDSPSQEYGGAGGESGRYSPWPSVSPAAWSLLGEGGSRLGPGGGLFIWGEDVVRRHRWSGDVLLYPRDSRLEANLGYRYAGLGNPVLNLEAGQNWLVRAAPGQVVDLDGVAVPSAQLRRDRSAAASASWLHRRIRSLYWLDTGVDVRDMDLVWQDPQAAGERAIPQLPLEVGTSLEAGFSSARAFTFSIGPRQGFSTIARAEARRFTRALTGDGSGPGYVRWTGRNRAFRGFQLPGYADHVLALRLDAGAERGSISPGFRVGGASGGAAPIPVPGDWIGRGVSFPVRGFAEGAQRGNRALSASAEYRFPILSIDRGFRLLPIFLQRTWGDLFVDTGAAWCPGDCELGFADPISTPEPLVSAGGELVIDLEILYRSSLPLRLGFAQPLNGTRPTRPQLYLRIGRSF